jgi:hypothetical protein
VQFVFLLLLLFLLPTEIVFEAVVEVEVLESDGVAIVRQPYYAGDLLHRM